MTDHSHPLTQWEREAIIRSVIGSQALSGVTISRALAEQCLDRALSEPLIELGENALATAEGAPEG